MASPKSPAACKLCGEVDQLQRSHVVPEFAYDPIYDENHKIIAFDPLKPDESWKIQKGLREPMLCRKCEQFLNDNYEKWFKEYWFDERPLAALETKDQEILSVPDANRFKLFHLSVLLRADLAAHGQWSEVNLGGGHRAKLVDMVRSQDPGEPHEYPIMCCAVRRSPEDPSIWWDVVAPPNPGRLYGMRFYQFTFGGCGWMYFVSSHRQRSIEHVALRPDGMLPVIKREWAAVRRYAPHAQLD